MSVLDCDQAPDEGRIMIVTVFDAITYNQYILFGSYVVLFYSVLRCSLCLLAPRIQGRKEDWNCDTLFQRINGSPSSTRLRVRLWCN
ncbi:hypothetical protein AMATHDRAFT_68060 [Amanita thiersii Skay4041]|uniref:Uncharacterized protein n=1 Tax=Amanita thiersii Skay4041 TaxID=703135 RepID=A0A2A9NHT2_9AGAR|nr:hypothetical protein AMATHDRAFT_68060 [Amanita thiersii Skay4041]